jgi:hypothetical protein
VHSHQLVRIAETSTRGERRKRKVPATPGTDKQAEVPVSQALLPA